MKRIPVQGIQPALLRWARESLELSIEDVASRIKGNPDCVEAWEKGTEAPTYAELEHLAYNLYKRPLAVFFLPSPPVEPKVKHEFRTLPQTDLDQLIPDTLLHIRKAQSFQIGIKEIFSNETPNNTLLLHELSLSLSQSVAEQAQRLRKILGISLDQQFRWRSDDTALKVWRSSLESFGVFVFKAPFKQKDVSGFCLPDPKFPIIYLNNSTTKTRQIFSLFHELGHLLLHVKGLSRFDSEYIDRLPEDKARVERFCNAFAAEILIPADDFALQIKNWPLKVDEIDDFRLEELALRYGVSREAILRKFLDQGRVNLQTYQKKAQYWATQMKKGSGGDYYASQNVYLSLRYAQEVVSQHYKKHISIEEAADYLGIPPKNFEGLEHRILQGVMV